MRPQGAPYFCFIMVGCTPKRITATPYRFLPALGAETHDIGRYGDRVLEPGMVLTVEPGLYIEEWEIGIRIEDDVLVTAEGNEVMTAAMLKTVDEIEAFMAKE